QRGWDSDFSTSVRLPWRKEAMYPSPANPAAAPHSKSEYQSRIRYETPACRRRYRFREHTVTVPLHEWFRGYTGAKRPRSMGQVSRFKAGYLRARYHDARNGRIYPRGEAEGEGPGNTLHLPDGKKPEGGYDQGSEARGR